MNRRNMSYYYRKDEIENEEYQYDLMKEEVHNVISFV